MRGIETQRHRGTEQKEDGESRIEDGARRYPQSSILYLLSSLCLCVSVVSILSSCSKPAARNELVVYTSVDKDVAEPILREFEKQTGIHVIVQYDAEATKTSGLVHRLEAEKDNPRADVWWSNEVFYTAGLAEKGVLAAYESPSGADIPKAFKDPQHRWAATAMRVRVLAVSTRSEAKSAVEGVKGLDDLARPAMRGHIAMARPSAGTTGAQIAALFALRGDEGARSYLNALKNNGIVLLGGNSIVAQQVGSKGNIWAGLTDNDDVDAARATGGQIEARVPDQGGVGTLALPCSVALVAGAQHSEAAKKLIDYLLSRQVEQKLIDAKFARYSVFAPPADVKLMQVDYAAAAKKMDEAIRVALEILEGRQ